MEHRHGQDDLVVLLHGIARTSRSMRPIEGFLGAAGYRTINLDYPSRHHDLGALAAMVGRQLAAAGAGNVSRLHFVTHSMGGLVVRHVLANEQSLRARVGRVVMLAPPSAGSEVADVLAPLAPYGWLFGPAGRQLTTGRCGDTPPIGPGLELGVVAGSTGWPYLLGTLLLPRPHDGRVSVERTRLDGMGDHLVVPATHSFIMRVPEVQRQVLHFIRHGHFVRPGEQSGGPSPGQHLEA